MTVCNNYNCDTCNPPLPERHCDRCLMLLEHVYSIKTAQYRSALHIQLHGGYGEFIDDNIETIICEKCTNELIESEPWLSQMLVYA